MNRIYLDHNATTPVASEVAAKMAECLKNLFGNPSSEHWFGQQARRAMDRARERVADLIGAEPSEIVFTSGGTEANNQALKCIERKGSIHSGYDPGHIVTSAIEHQAVLNTCRHLENAGWKVSYVPVDESGLIDTTALVRAISSRTVLVSIMLANNEVGTIQPLREISDIVRHKGVLLHTDAVQALGKIPVKVDELGVDLLSISGHKIYGPKGVGALYVRRNTPVGALLSGGHQEGKLRAGTENVPAIIGFGKACELAAGLLEDSARVSALRDRLQEMIVESVDRVRINGHPSLRLPNTLNFSFSGVDAIPLAMNLDIEGIAVSTGSACMSGMDEPSHVLTAMGRSPDQAREAIRISLGAENTIVEMEKTKETLMTIVSRLRNGAGKEDL